MSWEDDFRRNIERTRQRIMKIAPDMLDLRAHQSSADRRSLTRGMECVVTMSFAATAKLMEYSLISFGLCQSNIDGYDNISGPATDGTLVGTISLANAQSNEMYSVKLMDIGGPLWYHGCLKGRRVCMEERVLPLSSVAAAVKLDSINRIIFRINASDAPGEDAAFFVGNIKLIGKGP